MTEQEFVMPVFDTVQAAAEYGRPESVLREMMKGLRPGAKTFVFIGVGSVQPPRVVGLPGVVGGYQTVTQGHVDVVGVSALAVGDIHTDANGVTWEVMANVIRAGSAAMLGSHVFCAMEVTQ
jgi:hypothetical protein